MTSTTFITGIGGFIGLRLAERLREAGAEVWGVDRDPVAVERARIRGIRAELGDVNGGSELRALMRGADVVVHTAALVREYGALADFRLVNVEGSRNVAEAAREAGARTFVQLSSVMVYGFDFPDRVAEDGPLRGENNPYCQTKIESEEAVLALNEPGRLGVIVIRPGDVYGPGSMPWVGRPLQMLRKRRLLLPGSKGKINPVYVDNLIDAILLTIDAKPYGQAFNVTDGEAVSYREYFGKLAKLANLPGPIVVPAGIMNALVRLMVRLRELGVTQDEVGPDTARYLQRPHAYSTEKARRVLGYTPRINLEQGLALTHPYIERELARGL